MGDSDGSSNAAQGARETGHKTPKAEAAAHLTPPVPATTTAKPPTRKGLLSRLFGRTNAAGQGAQNARVNGSAPVAPSHGMINLRRMRVEDVAIPKADIIAVPLTITKDDLVQVFRDSGLTRLPVYDGTLDTPIGMAHLKDFALSYGMGSEAARFDLKKMLRPLVYVPPSMPIGVLLTKMQTERRHMALVIDEYGGVDGLVTIEDLIEQVIGEIEDEHDTDEGQFWTREATGCYVAQAKSPLDEFEAEIGMHLTDHDAIDAEEIDTLGGLVFMLAGHVPARGEVVPHPAGVDFEVIDADPRRIKRLRVRMPGTKGAKVAAARAPGAEATAESGHG